MSVRWPIPSHSYRQPMSESRLLGPLTPAIVIPIVLDAEKGAMVFTGDDSLFRATVAASPGSIIFAGTAANFRETLSAIKSTLTLTGRDSLFLQVLALVADKGLISFSSALAYFAETLDAAKSTLAFTPQAAVFRVAFILQADKATMSLTAKQVSFLETLSAAKGAIALTGADFHALETLLSQKATVVFIPKDATFEETHNVILTANKGLLFMTAQEATFGGAEGPTELRKIISLIEDRLSVVKG